VTSVGRDSANPGGPMNLPLLELLPTDPFLRFVGERREFSQLRISDWIRVLNPIPLKGLGGL
jgi:hypothetical protein